MTRRSRLLGPGLVLVLAAGLLKWLLEPPSSAWVEQTYSRGVYPALAGVVVPLSSAPPVSLTGLALVLLPFVLAFLLTRSWQRRRNFGAWLWAWMWGVTAGGVLAYALFLFVWGANYGRQPVEVLLNLPAEPAGASEVEDLARGLVDVLRRDAANLGSRDGDVALASLRRSLVATVEAATGVAPALPARAKRLPPGFLLTFGNAGIVSPWTLEAHVDGALPGPARLAVGAHELAHVAGFAGEADADLIAALAGLRADDAYARYATALRLFAQVGRQLSQDRYRTLYDQLPEPAKIDLAEMIEVSTRYISPAATQMVRSAYDRYLKSQGVEAGLADYSRTVNLLAHAWRQDFATPNSPQVASR